MSGRNSESLFYLALVHVVAGRFEQSLGLLQEAVRQDEDYRHLIANDPFLQRLSEQEQWAIIVPLLSYDESKVSLIQTPRLVRLSLTGHSF